jgi:hypothetical protein
MSSILDIEQAASRLRHHLKIAQLPGLKLLCGLQFFELLVESSIAGMESYVREFIPALAEAAGKCRPQEFLPEEADALTRLASALEKIEAGIIGKDVPDLFMKLGEKINGGDGGHESIMVDRKDVTCLTCLFVEYNPDLDLPPRGRLLNLEVSANSISLKTEEDDVVVRNPVSEPDDRFLSQARDSVRAARKYLHEKYGLSLNKKYRFDFAINSTGAQFTGDSLGVAFAVGAIAAVEKVEIFREKLSISPDVAFSGALSADGKLEPVDEDALKLKIYRAFHSGIRYLVIPREHITDAWQYLSELEKKHPDRTLELVGADMLDTVAADPRLVPTERLSVSTYFARKAWQAKRSTWVETPGLSSSWVSSLS